MEFVHRDPKLAGKKMAAVRRTTPQGSYKELGSFFLELMHYGRYESYPLQDS